MEKSFLMMELWTEAPEFINEITQRKNNKLIGKTDSLDLKAQNDQFMAVIRSVERRQSKDYSFILVLGLIKYGANAWKSTQIFTWLN